MGVVFRYIAAGAGPPPPSTSTTSSNNISPSSYSVSHYSAAAVDYVSDATSRLSREASRYVRRRGPGETEPNSSPMFGSQQEGRTNSTRCHVTNMLLFSIHFEIIWWLRLNWAQYRRVRNNSNGSNGEHATTTERPVAWILPQPNFEWDDWKAYGRRLWHRLMPVVYEYNQTITLVRLFQSLMGLFASHDTMIKVTQNPFHRAIFKAASSGHHGHDSKRPDRLIVGTDSFVTCLWANATFFLSVYASGQFFVWYNYRQSRNHRSTQSSSSNTPTEVNRRFWTSSWRMLSTTFRRYYTSAVGAGLGSMVWPGWGTLIGMGLGDGIAELQPDPEIPPRLIEWSSNLAQIIQKRQAKLLGSTGGRDDDSGLVVDDEIMCGCCQIVGFSSDPNAPNRAPVSSRECSHTICKKCVQQLHLSLVERVHIYTEWIPCPICKAPGAFSSHNHHINRSLCSAIGLLEQRQLQVKQMEDQLERARRQPPRSSSTSEPTVARISSPRQKK